MLEARILRERHDEAPSAACVHGAAKVTVISAEILASASALRFLLGQQCADDALQDSALPDVSYCKLPRTWVARQLGAELQL